MVGMSMLRLRGGDDSDDEHRTIFDKMDGLMKATLGRTSWGFIKFVIGWRDKPKRSPSQDLKELQSEAEARKKRGAIVDKKMSYFFSKGPFYALNPLTHLSRFIAGTERNVKAGVLLVNAERAGMSPADIRAKLMAPKAKGGLGLTKARVGEVFYRADFKEEDTEAPVKELAFTDEEDAELEAFKKKALEKSSGGKGGGEAKLHAAATKKWSGASGNVVKRLQKELIGIQSAASFEVELVNDSIFHWWVTIEGAKGSFYEDEKFKLSFKFDATYPTKPPEVTFVAKVHQ
jgi:hypothetical protein